MKKTVFRLFPIFLTFFGVLSFASSCSKQGNTQIKLDSSEITLLADGTVAHIGYRVENPSEGQTLTVEPSSEQWIHDYSVTDSDISFTVDPNEETTPRETSFAVKYAGSKAEIHVLQEKFEPLSFTIDLKEVSESSVEFDILPSKDDETFIMMNVDKKYYEQLGSDQAVIRDMVDFLKDNAKKKRLTLEEFLEKSESLKKGVQLGVVFEGFKPSTEHYILALGMDAQGNVTSGLHAEPFTTKEVEKVEMSFQFDFTPKGKDLLVKVTPSDNQNSYYYDFVPKKTLQDKKQTIEEYLDVFLSQQIKLGQMFKLTTLQVMETLLVKGPAEKTFKGRLKPDTEYVIYAASILPFSGIVNSKVSTVEFRSPAE